MGSSAVTPMPATVTSLTTGERSGLNLSNLVYEKEVRSPT